MASPVVGTSLGQNPFRVQDTFTWEDLRHGLGRTAEQARHNWEVNDLPKNEEAHFFELGMNTFRDEGEFFMVLSVRLYPYDYLILTETVSLQATKAEGLVPLVMTYLKGLFGEPLTKRATHRYGRKMLEWVDSAAIMYAGEE